MSANSSCSVAVIGTRLANRRARGGRAANKILRRNGFGEARRVEGGVQGLVCSRWNAHRQGFDASHEAGIHPLRLANHLDLVESLQHLLPYNLQLQFGEPHANAAMDAEAERQMRAGTG